MGRHTPIQVPNGPSQRSATAQCSGVRTCPGWIANGVIAQSDVRRQSGKRTGSVLPSTPQPSRGSPGEGASEAISSRPLSGSASSSRSSLCGAICSSGETAPPWSRSTTTALVRPWIRRSRASSRPVRSSQAPPEHGPGTSARCSGPKAPPATSHTAVECGPTARAYARSPPGAGGSSRSRVPSGHSTAPRGSSPVPGPVGYSREKVCRPATSRRMRTRPSPIGCTSVPGSSGWLPGSGTAYGSGPSSVQRSGYQESPLRASRAA